MTTTPTNGAASHMTATDAPTCTPCGTLMINAGAVWKCLCCDAIRPRGEFAEFVRVIARGAGMSPSDTPAAIAARVAEQHRDLTALTPAVAAFYAAAKGLPSHVHTRPVCAVSGCDNGPRKDALCARHYEAALRPSTKPLCQLGGCLNLALPDVGFCRKHRPIPAGEQKEGR